MDNESAGGGKSDKGAGLWSTRVTDVGMMVSPRSLRNSTGGGELMDIQDA